MQGESIYRVRRSASMVASAWRLLESGTLGGSQLCACSARYPLGANCALPAGLRRSLVPGMCRAHLGCAVVGLGRGWQALQVVDS